MKIRVNQGMLAKRYSKSSHRNDFAFLFPGIYEAELLPNQELVMHKSTCQITYLHPDMIIEKVNKGAITFLELGKLDKSQFMNVPFLYK
jgi:hypothetical protein